MKRAAESSIDHHVMEGLKLIRYTASHIMKKIEARLPLAERKESESTIMTALANLPRLLNGETLDEISNRKYVRPTDCVSFTKDCENSELKNFISSHFNDISDQVNSIKLQNRRLNWYGIRVRKRNCINILAFISERPTVYRNLYIFVDKKLDQMFFLFREQKACQLKKVERLLKEGFEVELYNLKTSAILPKKYDKELFKTTICHPFVKGTTMTKPGWGESLKKFKREGN